MPINVNNSGKQSPRWFRIFKKVWTNTETAAIVILLSMGYTQDSFILLIVKTGSSWLLENLDTVLSGELTE